MINWLKGLLLMECEQAKKEVGKKIKELEKKRDERKYLEVEGVVFNEFLDVNGVPTIHTGFVDEGGLFPRFMQNAAKNKKQVKARLVIEVLG